MRAGEVVTLLQGQGAGPGLALALASVVLAPVLEELLFRGFLLPCLAARMPLPAAVGPSAVLVVLCSLRPWPSASFFFLGCSWRCWQKRWKLLCTAAALFHA